MCGCACPMAWRAGGPLRKRLSETVARGSVTLSLRVTRETGAGPAGAARPGAADRRSGRNCAGFEAGGPRRRALPVAPVDAHRRPCAARSRRRRRGASLPAPETLLGRCGAADRSLHRHCARPKEAASRRRAHCPDRPDRDAGGPMPPAAAAARAEPQAAACAPPSRRCWRARISTRPGCCRRSRPLPSRPT